MTKLWYNIHLAALIVFSYLFGLSLHADWSLVWPLVFAGCGLYALVTLMFSEIESGKLHDAS